MSTSSTAVAVNGCCFDRRCRYRCRRVRSDDALRVTSPLRTVLCYCRKLLLKLSRARIFVAKHIYLLPPHSLNSHNPVPKMSTLSGPGAAERPREGVVVGVEELLHLSPERYAGARGRVGELRRPVVHLGPVPCRGR